MCVTFLTKYIVTDSINSIDSFTMPDTSSADGRDSQTTVEVPRTTAPQPTDLPTATYAGGSLRKSWKAASREASYLKALSRFYKQLASMGTGTKTDEKIAMETVITAMNSRTSNVWNETAEKEPEQFKEKCWRNEAKVNAITQLRIEDITNAAVKANQTKANTWQLLCTMLSEQQLHKIHHKQRREDIEIGVKEYVRLSRKAARLKINNQRCNARHKCEDIRQIFKQKAISNNKRTRRHRDTTTQGQARTNIRAPEFNPAATAATTTSPSAPITGQAQTTMRAPEDNRTASITTPVAGQSLTNVRDPKYNDIINNWTHQHSLQQQQQYNSRTTGQHPQQHRPQGSL
jgi:hypothetical protein